MLEEQKLLLIQARDSLEVARNILEDGYPGFSAARAYYTMFYAFEALFLEQEMAFSKHAGIIAAFSQYYVKTGIFDKKYSTFLREGFELRMVGDYGKLKSVTVAEADVQLERANELLIAIEARLKGDPK